MAAKEKTAEAEADLTVASSPSGEGIPFSYWDPILKPAQEQQEAEAEAAEARNSAPVPEAKSKKDADE